MLNAADGMQTAAMWDVAATFHCPVVLPFLSGPDPRSMSLVERDPVDAIVEFFQESNFPELASKSSEVAFLEEWLAEVSEKRPRSRLEIMQREMESAISKELYERAAELRDAIRMLKAAK